RFGVPLELGRGPGALRLRESRAAWGSLEALVPGRVVLDGIQLLRGSFVKMDEYGLDFVAREVLGEGKLLRGHDRAEEIVDTFLHDREKFVAYNLTDARLVIEILERLNLVELAVERSLLTGLPIHRVAGSIASLDFLYLSELGRRGMVAPSVAAADADASANLGGEVLEPEPGLYRNVLVFDFKSLYPSIIRTFQIDPLGYLPAPAPGDDPIVAPNGAAFRRRPGILPGLIDELLPRREAAKAAGDAVASHAIKILMNSFYGVLGTPACRFYRPELAGAITAFGREILGWSKERLELWGHRVLYGDTDSLFVLSGEDDAPAAWELGRRLVAELNRDVARHVREKWRVESRLELELEKLYHRLLLPSMRHGRGGARKRYAGLVGEGEGAEVVFTGMESVRRDWTELAKRVQRELYERLFHDREVGEYLRRVVADLRQGKFDELLVYRKALRKGLQEYTATTPPHVAAARKMSGRSGRLIAYVMTTNGAEPAAERRSPIDHEHYVDKQVRPVAEPVLGILGLDFDRAIGDDAQLELF
ncbi:MAG: DNA polymerase II, partial [bacterium]|nr:DNA polymerase II [bacterium]